jgi:RimJ/RimL family protein N-acetyltransferase
MSGWRLPAAPVLCGPQLAIDPAPEAWSAASRQALEDPDFYRWGYFSQVLPPELREQWLRQRMLFSQLGRARYFAVLRPGAQSPVGLIDVWVDDAHQRWGEASYRIHPGHRGQNIATAALRLLTDWALDRAGALRLDLPIHPDNAASQAVARNAGYAYRGPCHHTPAVAGSHMVDLYTASANGAATGAEVDRT